MGTHHPSGYLAAIAITAATIAPLASQPVPTGGRGAIITGHIVDPHQLRTPDMTLLMWYQTRPYASSGDPIPLAADGTFVTPPLLPGTYVFEATRASSSAAADLRGVAVVGVGVSDVSNVRLELRRPTVLTGRYRMESDDPEARWPSHMYLIANLALDGLDLGTSHVFEGGPNGTFVLRNAFGPRILKYGGGQEPGRSWWPARVVLDGKDITNVPTDFSRHEGGALEFVLTQHPPRLEGTVTDAYGRLAGLAWVVAIGADRGATQPWSARTFIERSGPTGRFSMPVTPGRFRIHALPGGAFQRIEEGRYGLSGIGPGGTPVTVQPREQKTVALTLQQR
jgi:hypothetical protein